MLMRRFLLYLSTAAWARNIATSWSIARRVAQRFVASETLKDALNVTETLNSKGVLVTLDYLGESVASAKDTEIVLATYLSLLDGIHQRRLGSSISLKPTHLGLDISEELCVSNLRHILARAQQYHIPVTLDMESSDYTDTTLRIYRTLRDEYNFDNVGTVIQAYLYRTEQDMQDLASENAHIRLCKGAYLEPAEVAFPAKSDVDNNYVKVMQTYLSSASSAYLCIATHDEAMIQAAESFIQAHKIPQERYEFQMLYGIRTSRQEELAKQHKIRVYVPFGEAWYPYFVRRLAERPANLWFFVKSFTRA
jgi:proline dehydrogenase